jgi:hypothetical protein
MAKQHNTKTIESMDRIVADRIVADDEGWGVDARGIHERINELARMMMTEKESLETKLKQYVKFHKYFSFGGCREWVQQGIGVYHDRNKQFSESSHSLDPVPTPQAKISRSVLDRIAGCKTPVVNTKTTQSHLHG